jgi:hypothetical protein
VQLVRNWQEAHVMKAISLRQPYAWAVVYGGKDVENRTWRTGYLGAVLIHAARAWHAIGPAELEARMAAKGVRLSVPRDLPRGGIVGMATITDCVTASDSPWFEGPYGFLLRDPRPLPFHPCPGSLGLFEVEVAGFPPAQCNNSRPDPCA